MKKIIRKWLGLNKISMEMHDIRQLIIKNQKLFKQDKVLKEIIVRKKHN